MRSGGITAAGIMRAGVLAVGAGAIALAAQASPPAHDSGAPASRSVAHLPVDAATLVCPGGSSAPAGSASPTVAMTSAPVDLASLLHSGGVVRAGVDAAAADVPLHRGASATLPAPSGPFVVGATGAAAPGLAATQYVTQGGALAARACTNSANEAWIPVGDKQSGRLLTVVLVNSGSHAASVDIDVRAADGDVASAAIADKAVPAHSRVEVNVPADALSHAAPVVHVRSEGGAVQASVRDAASSGGVAGEELVAQYTSAATVQSIPDAPVTDGRTQVRLVAPDARAAVVRLQVWSAGESVSHDTVVTIPAGRTQDVEVTGLRGRVAGVRASSDRPIIASALGVAASKGARDFAWSPASPDIADAAGVSLDGVGSGGVLAVMSDGHARTVTVVTQAAGSTTRTTLAVPADGVATLAVAKDASVWVTAATRDGMASVEAAVLIGPGVATMATGAGTNGALTSVPLVPAPWTRTPVTVTQG